MGKLHEILSVRDDADNIFKKIIQEARVTFGKGDHFYGSVKSLEMFDDVVNDKIGGEVERKAMTTTVMDKLDYITDATTRFFDILFQQDRTNQAAKADIIVDGNTILTDVPATFLLTIEKKLNYMREMYDAIPTLAPGVDWAKDDTQGKDVWKRVHPEEKFKTAQKFVAQVLYDATKEHPAQVEKIAETENVGKFTKRVWSGMISPAEKSNLLRRLDLLIAAVKEARQRANCEEVQNDHVGDEIMKFIHYGG